MKNKKVKTMLAVAAAVAGSGICLAVKHGRKKGAADTGTGGSVLEEEGLTEEKVKKYLLRLFQLYEDNEFDELADFSGNGNGVREYAADNYSGQIFPYIKENMKDVMMLEGDDGTGKEPFDMTDELFCCPACLIGCEINELFSDRFTLCLENEIWMLENGEFASVYCVSIGKDGGRLSYRFLDTYIRNPGDIPICFSDLESGFTGIIEALKKGWKPELP